MKYFLFFANYFFAICSFTFFVGDAPLVGIMFALAYLFSYWMATKPEPEQDPELREDFDELYKSYVARGVQIDGLLTRLGDKERK